MGVLCVLEGEDGRQEKIREKTRREKKQDNCVFFFKITRPSNNFEFSKLPLPTLKAFSCDCKLKLFLNYLGIHFRRHGSLFRALGHLPGGLIRFIPCHPSAHYTRLLQ